MASRHEEINFFYSEIWKITRKSGASLTCITWNICIALYHMYHRNITPPTFVRYHWQGYLYHWNISPTYFVRCYWHSRDNFITKIFHQLTSWDIIDYHWLSLIIIGYHWLSFIIIDHDWLSLVYFIDYHHIIISNHIIDYLDCLDYVWNSEKVWLTYWQLEIKRC